MREVCYDHVTTGTKNQGYIQALRFFRHAEKSGFLPICFIDTPGADPGMDSGGARFGECYCETLSPALFQGIVTRVRSSASCPASPARSPSVRNGRREKVCGS